MARSGAGFQEDHPQLPRYTARRIKIPKPLDQVLGVSQAVRITCHSPICKGEKWFIVTLSWFKSRNFLTRSCPYCFRAGVLPERPKNPI